MTTHYTKYFRLPVPDFLTEPWVQELSTTFDVIDATMYGVQAASQLFPWANSTSYVIGQVAIDNEFGTVWSCSVTHTSAAAPTTFSQDRTANPTFWSFGIVAVAEAAAVSYNHATSGMSSINVQAAIDELSAETIGEAPNDGQQYARQSLEWTVVTGTGGGGGGGAPPSDTVPLMDGVGAAGVANLYSRGDHVHPSDTARVAKAGDTMTGALTVNPNIQIGSVSGMATAITSKLVVGNATTNSVVTVGQADGNRGSLAWNCDPTPANAYLNIATASYANPIKINGSSIQINDVSNGPITIAGQTGFTVSPTAPTPTTGDSSNKVATTGFMVSNLANSVVTFPKMAASAIATYTDFLANVANKLLTTDQAWLAAAPNIVTDAATVTLDFSTGIDFVWTVTNVGRTLANPINMKAGQKGVIYIRQDATGNRTITSWGTNWLFPGGVKPTLSTAPNSWDAISYTVPNASGPVLVVFNKGFA